MSSYVIKELEHEASSNQYELFNKERDLVFGKTLLLIPVLLFGAWRHYTSFDSIYLDILIAVYFLDL